VFDVFLVESTSLLSRMLLILAADWSRARIAEERG
jgi:hypothetical protein